MTEKSKKFWKNFFEFISYSLVGLVTTFVSYGVRWVILHFFSEMHGIDLQSTNLAMVGGSSVLRSIAQTMGWIVGLLFCFLPFKVLVFRNKEWGWKHLFRQFRKFLISRIITYFFELILAVALPIIMQAAGYRAFWLFGWHITLMTADNMTMVISIILVTAINYLIGKWIVFPKQSTLPKELPVKEENKQNEYNG